MNNAHVATAQIVSYVEDMIAIPKVLALLDGPALYVLTDLILKGRNHRYLSRSDFVKGFEIGYGCGLEGLEDIDLASVTFGVIIQEVEMMLSHAIHAREDQWARSVGWLPIDHSCHVGSAFGLLSSLFDCGFVFRLPRTPAELQRRSLASLLPVCHDSALQEETV